MASKSTREQVEEYIVSLQDRIVSALEEIDPRAAPFKRDSWVRAQGGHGRSCIFPPSSSIDGESTVLEKAGVNISIVHGMLPPGAIKQMRADHSAIPFDPDAPTGLPFFAAGISLVIHPRNPNAPTVHANYRYFEITEPGAEGGNVPKKILAWWFGGGSDLTPSYLFDEDAKHFHGTLKSVCDQHGPGLYPAFKTWCDQYFFIPHRAESRGIGGIFFDDLNSGPHKRLLDEDVRPRLPEEIFSFIKSIGDAFVPSYLPILKRRMNVSTNERQRRWQLLRRGRYVEFNLVYDRGTKFGLNTPGARIESILMSLPETARWEYMSDLGGDGQGSEEGKLIEVLKKPQSWA
jgi:coproporphyrinogen III oxidase